MKKKLSDEEKLIAKQKRELARQKREEEYLQEELRIKKEKEEFQKTIPLKMLQLIIRANQHNISFEIFRENNNINVKFLFDEDCYRIIDLTSDSWSIESLEGEFDYLDIEVLERKRKEQVRRQAIEKVKTTLTTEEIELIRGYL